VPFELERMEKAFQSALVQPPGSAPIHGNGPGGAGDADRVLAEWSRQGDSTMNAPDRAEPGKLGPARLAAGSPASPPRQLAAADHTTGRQNHPRCFPSQVCEDAEPAP
jgi:hypothetical protein